MRIDLRILGLFLLLLVPACAAPNYPYPENGKGGPAAAPGAGGPVPSTQADSKELDANLAKMNGQISGLDTQIATLNQQILDYRNSPGQENRALQAQTQRDQLQMQRNALAERQGGLQIIRNSKQPHMPAGPVAPPPLPAAPSFPPPAPIH